jgi:hypothetical protein
MALGCRLCTPFLTLDLLAKKVFLQTLSSFGRHEFVSVKPDTPRLTGLLKDGMNSRLPLCKLTLGSRPLQAKQDLILIKVG